MPRLPERGYPLSALFILMAACAIPMSMAAAAGRAVSAGDVGARDVTFAAIAGCAVVMGLGMIVGLHHYRPFLGVILGAMAGAIVGSMAGPMVLAPEKDFLNLLALSVGGSAAMVAAAAWLRAGAQRRHEPEPPEWFDERSPFQS
jgi:uncharacterized membrane protein